MDRSNPTVSICIPSYNSEEFIAEAIQSVLQQTYQDFELIIVDDCSTDATYEAVSKLIQKAGDSRIHLFRNEKNRGAKENWNACLSKARGKYLKILCSDDWIYPHCLELQVNVLSNPEYSRVALVCGRKDVISRSGKVLFRARGMKRTGVISKSGAYSEILKSGTNPIGEPLTVLFRSELIPKVGGFEDPLPYVIDLNYWCRLLEFGDLYSLSETVGAFRLSLKSWSYRIGWNQYAQVSRFFTGLYEKMIKMEQTSTLTGRLRTSLMLGKAKAAIFCILRLSFYSFFDMGQINDTRKSK